MINRFGFDVSGQPIEDLIRWASENSFRYIDFQADYAPE